MRREFEASGIKVVFNEICSGRIPNFLCEGAIRGVRRFHQSIEGYQPTPLASLKGLAKTLGVGGIYVKDESKRFGLNAFKSLGGTYAIARLLCEELDMDIEEIDFNYFKSNAIREKIKNRVFVTATDGNHGKGVAWAATQLGCKSVVYLPMGAAKERVEAIREVGGEAYVTDLNYDDAVRLASEKAVENGWRLVQDTAWEGYEKIPNWITQGYTTMAYEAIEQLKEVGIKKPTHVFLQAGVGSMAGAVLGYYATLFEGNQPTTIIVEPERAACIYTSAVADDGKPHFVKGELNTMMAGLACGEPNPITWEILRDFAKAYMSCPDEVAARGMRILARPIGEDERIISGESGAVGVGLLSLLMKDEKMVDVKEALGLNEESIVLFFSTEGDTDAENYNRIVYGGKDYFVLNK